MTTTPATPTPRGDLLSAMLERRSISVLSEPGPTHHELDLILRAATTVPDHGSLQPWRFIVVAGNERERFGAALRDAGVADNPDMHEAVRDKLFKKAFVAPTLIVLVSSPEASNVARWEQEASAASAGYAMTLAAHVLGVGAIWKSAPVRSGLALTQLFDLGADDLLMGWVNLGTAAVKARDRRRPPDLSKLAHSLHDGTIVSWTPATYT